MSRRDGDLLCPPWQVGASGVGAPETNRGLLTSSAAHSAFWELLSLLSRSSVERQAAACISVPLPLPEDGGVVLEHRTRGCGLVGGGHGPEGTQTEAEGSGLLLCVGTVSGMPLGGGGAARPPCGCCSRI